MEPSLVASRAGPPACRAGEAWLHSRFDPSREADRFAAASLGDGRPPAVVLLGPCLGYLGEAVRRILPRATLVSVQHSPFFRGREVFEADFSWYPDSDRSLDEFLDSALDEDAVSGLAVLSWPPAEMAFPEESRAAAGALRASLDRLASSSATVKVFGKRWIANACRSYLLAETALSMESTDAPVVVAAAGPSLVPSLHAIAPVRGSIILIAVSSALAACRAAGLDPDIVVSTDGGNWSRLHLYPLAARSAPIASPLIALPSASLSGRAPFLLIDQGGFAESRLLPTIGAPDLSIIRVPPHGTVSGTAILVASRLGSGPVIAAGLDLACLGDLDHARPHGFDYVSSGSSGRLYPEEGDRWSRAAESAPDATSSPPWRTSRSLSAYASGLDSSLGRLRGRLFRLNPSPISLPAFEALDDSALRSLLGGLSSAAGARRGSPFAGTAQPLRPRASREAELRGALSEWRALASDSSELLASGRLVADDRVAELLRSIDIVDYAASRRAILSGGDPAAAARELGRRADRFLLGLEELLVR
jgi:hypothetical protein